MFNDIQRREDDDFELFAAYDAKREAFGDPCPGCKRLRGGGDCAYCFDEGDGRDEPVVAAAPRVPVVLAPLGADDIDF